MKINKGHFYIAIVASLLISFGAASCSTQAKLYRKAEKGQKLPPGQVKKVTGSQSAAPYAPGQVKKRREPQPAPPHGPEKDNNGKKDKGPKPAGHR